MEEKIRLAVFGQKRLSREGGIEIVVKELCTRMAQNGCDVTCYNRAGHHVSGAEYDKTIEYDGIWFLSHVSSVSLLPFSPKRLPASSSQAAYRSFHRKRQNSLAPLLLLSPQSHATLRGPRQWRRVSPLVRKCGASPAGVFLFGRLFIFQGAVHR